MFTKLITFCATTATAFALLLPSTSSASPVLTDGLGSKLPIGITLSAQTTGAAFFTGGLSMECTFAELVGKLTLNSGTSVKAEVPVGSATYKGDSEKGDCTSALGEIAVTVNSKLCLATNAVADQIEITGCGNNVTFSLAVTGAGMSCKYETAQLVGTFDTSPSDFVMHFSEQPLGRETPNIFCPAGAKLNQTLQGWNKTGLGVEDTVVMS